MMVKIKYESLYPICVLAALMLLWPTGSMAGISGRGWLIYAVTAAGSIAAGLVQKNIAAAKLKKRWAAEDFLLGILLLWNLLQVAAAILSGAGAREGQLLSIVLVLLYFLVSAQRERFLGVVVKVILLCGGAVYLLLLWYFLLLPERKFLLEALLQDSQGLASFLLLVNTTAAEEYYRRKDRTERVFCLVLLAVGFFLLLIVGDVMGVTLMGVSFPLTLVLHEPVKELVKRVGQVALLWFLMFSNMCLVTNYTSLVNSGGVYLLEDSVYLELAVAVAGLCFFSWWDKLPRGGAVPLYGFQTVMRRLLAGMVLSVFLLLAFSDKLGRMSESGAGPALLGRWSAQLSGYVSTHNGTFLDVLQNYGAVGVVWLLGLALSIAGRLFELLRAHRVRSRLVVIVAMYLLQSLFFSQQALTTPVYVILGALVLQNSIWEAGGEESGIEEPGAGEAGAEEPGAGTKEKKSLRRKFREKFGKKGVEKQRGV